ncbi:MAG: 50S ribosomal protein L6 [Elusimicrobia bacterium]|jgi:large subunit ribosomal protein L6|nr:50S ribosomal protein L6 [Elusimicrobiota bacterium]MBK7207288.1 50S ribosomal protein L6 [Elusimicrobiota bacterium]MBK7546101.1 50S ribosomal protein L6 [Elusimicrobiota bacterium]MBK7575448.1 50S ribosomal protein L6 [Elusimicrobiota bacterium]MBK7689160.1 50S ribosomal protein L6 [Elusimicrobiota bacterium]
MSRLGKKPISLPDKVKVNVQGATVSVTGPLGQLSRVLPAGLSAKLEGPSLTVDRKNDSPTQKALHGTFRKLLLNMVEGAATGFSKELRIGGVGFRAQINGNKLNMTLGYSHPIDYTVPVGVKVTVDQKQTTLVVSGADKQLVGQVAAEIREFRKPGVYWANNEPVGIRYANEHVRRKAGKAAAGAAGAAGGAKK